VAQAGTLDLTGLEALTPPPTGGAELFRVAATSDALYAAATIPNADEWEVLVWRSLDHGHTWEEILSLIGDGTDTDLVATEDEVVLLMSNHVGPGESSIHRSTDGGATWQRIGLEAPEGTAGIAVTALANNGGQTAVLGTAWTSTETETFDDGAAIETQLIGWHGVSWAVADGAVSGPFEQPQLGYVTAATGHGGRYFAVGNTLGPDQAAAAWSSSDGVTWTPLDLPALPDQWALTGEFDTVASSNGSIILAGQVYADGTEPLGVATVVYASSEGSTWTVRIIDDHLLGEVIGTPAGFIGRASPSATDHPPSIARSTDGVTWTFDDTAIAILGGASTDDSVYLVALDTTTVADTLWRLPIR
jgi:hypothetical protein